MTARVTDQANKTGHGDAVVQRGRGADTTAPDTAITAPAANATVTTPTTTSRARRPTTPASPR